MEMDPEHAANNIRAYREMAAVHEQLRALNGDALKEFKLLIKDKLTTILTTCFPSPEAQLDFLRRIVTSCENLTKLEDHWAREELGLGP